MKAKYEVNQYVGVPITADDSGKYVIKREGDGGLSYIRGEPGGTVRASFAA